MNEHIEKLKNPKNYVYAVIVIAFIYIMSTHFQAFATNFAILVMLGVIFYYTNETWARVQFIQNELEQRKK
jgi:hypothetical protein